MNATEVREGGTGLYIKNNAAQVLEESGLFDRLLSHGSRLQRAQRIDHAGRVMQERSLAGEARVHVIERQMLMEALRDGAEKAGAEVVTGSTVIGADPAGELHLEDGRRLRARPRDRGRWFTIQGAGRPRLIERPRAPADAGEPYLVPSRKLPLEPTREGALVGALSHRHGPVRPGLEPRLPSLSGMGRSCSRAAKQCRDLVNGVPVPVDRDRAAGADHPGPASLQRRSVPALVHGTCCRHRRCGLRRCTPALGQGVPGLVLTNARACLRPRRAQSPGRGGARCMEAAVRSHRFDNAQRWRCAHGFFDMALVGSALVLTARNPSWAFAPFLRLAAGCGLRIKD